MACNDCGPCAWSPSVEVDTVATGFAGVDPQGNPAVEIHFYPAQTCTDETHDRYLMRWTGARAELDLDFGTQLDATQVEEPASSVFDTEYTFHWKHIDLAVFVHRVSDSVIQLDWQTPDATTTYQCELVGDAVTCEAI